jgi:hypothetical protein
MIELRVRIDRENAEKVIQLIRELVGSDDAIVTSVEKSETPTTAALGVVRPPLEYLTPPPALGELVSGKLVLTESAKYIGTWGQFNSFFPLKAVLRVLAHLTDENKQDKTSLQVLVDRSISAFKVAGLHKFRGFPKKYKKESSIGRLVWHFITTAYQTGLIGIRGDAGIPAHGWDNVFVSITKEGFEFCQLENRVLDWKAHEQVLTDAEKNWVVKYLKKIDSEGFKEYSLLKAVFQELKKNNTHISEWLEHSESFRTYVKSWSRKKEDTVEFAKQMRTVAIMFAQSKIALLRELGVVSNRRDDYSITGSLGD